MFSNVSEFTEATKPGAKYFRPQSGLSLTMKNFSTKIVSSRLSNPDVDHLVTMLGQTQEDAIKKATDRPTSAQYDS